MKWQLNDNRPDRAAMLRVGGGERNIMSIVETAPSEPRPKPRWYQFSLRSLLLLTTVTAVLLSAASVLGYMGVVIALAVILLVVGITHYPRCVHPLTRVAVAVMAAALLSLNLSPTKLEELRLKAPPPYDLDPVSKAMFYRGWPVAPWMSVSHGGGWAMVFDCLFCVAVLFAVKVACEQCFFERAWLASAAYGVVLLGLFTLVAVITFRINSTLNVAYRQSPLPVYLISTCVGVCVVALVGKSMADRRRKRGPCG